MGGCEFEIRLSAYLDGELDADARMRVELHLAQCPACSAELAQLKALSSEIGTTLGELPEISQIALHRIHAKVEDVADEGVIRWARGLSVAAAIAMAVSSIWLMKINDVEATAPPWAGLASNVDSGTPSIDTSTPAAVWYLADAGNRGDEMP